MKVLAQFCFYLPIHPLEKGISKDLQVSQRSLIPRTWSTKLFSTTSNEHIRLGTLQGEDLKASNHLGKYSRANAPSTCGWFQWIWVFIGAPILGLHSISCPIHPLYCILVFEFIFSTLSYVEKIISSLYKILFQLINKKFSFNV